MYGRFSNCHYKLEKETSKEQAKESRQDKKITEQTNQSMTKLQSQNI